MSDFDLVRPCDNCPFRNDIPGYLTVARVEELDDGLERGMFHCHKTTIESDYDDMDLVPGPDSQHCAGALILLEKMNRPSQMMRIAERLGMYDPSKLDMDAPVFDSFEEMMDAQSD